MSYTYEQKINGKIYVYQAEGHWDKAKKQARLKRTYLGRKDEVTGEIKTRRKKQIPIGSYNVGSLYFLKKLCKQLNLFKVVKEIFPDDYEKILHLSCFKIIKKEPYYFYQSWCEESYVSKASTLSSIGVSKFLSKLGQDELAIELFFKRWMGETKSLGAVMFDITSISSYGTRNEFLERGYNRDGDDLEQVNLGLVARTPKGESAAGLPIAYRIYPGSITDVTTLENVTKLMRQYDLKLDVLVMDKGFYSQENIKGMSKKGLNYIVPMSFSTKLSMKILLNLHEEILSPQSLFSFYEQVYAYSYQSINLGGENCLAHVFLDKKRWADQESKFIRKISDVETFFKEKEFTNREEAKVYLEETLKTKKKFFFIKENGRGFTIERNIEAFKLEIMRMGCMILITNDTALKRDDILYLYRRKDSIEGCANNMM